MAQKTALSTIATPGRVYVFTPKAEYVQRVLVIMLILLEEFLNLDAEISDKLPIELSID